MISHCMVGGSTPRCTWSYQGTVFTGGFWYFKVIFFVTTFSLWKPSVFGLLLFSFFLQCDYKLRRFVKRFLYFFSFHSKGVSARFQNFTLL